MNDLIYWVTNLFENIFESNLESHWMLFGVFLMTVMVLKFMVKNFTKFIFLATVMLVAGLHFAGLLK